MQLTVALTAGVGCGIFIGTLLASRRRPYLPATGKEMASSQCGLGVPFTEGMKKTDGYEDDCMTGYVGPKRMMH